MRGTLVSNFHCIKLLHQLQFNQRWNCTSCLKGKTSHSHNSPVVSSPHLKMDIDLAIPVCVGIHDDKPLINTISTILIERKVGSRWEGDERSTLGSYFAPSPLVKALDNLRHEHYLGHWNAFNYSSHNWSYCYNKRAKSWSGLLEKMKALLKFNL